VVIYINSRLTEDEENGEIAFEEDGRKAASGFFLLQELKGGFDDALRLKSDVAE
jgi:hypothetical protein